MILQGSSLPITTRQQELEEVADSEHGFFEPGFTRQHRKMERTTTHETRSHTQKRQTFDQNKRWETEPTKKIERGACATPPHHLSCTPRDALPIFLLAELAWEFSPFRKCEAEHMQVSCRLRVHSAPPSNHPINSDTEDNSTMRDFDSSHEPLLRIKTKRAQDFV